MPEIGPTEVFSSHPKVVTTAPFSVLMSVYAREFPPHFEASIVSVLRSNLLPKEIVLIVDGPVPNLINDLIDKYQALKHVEFNVIRLDENCGLGVALRLGVEVCNQPLVARMDTDDICCPNRFHLQYQFLCQNPDVGIVGGQIDEFIDEPNLPTYRRTVPEWHNEIVRQSQYRNPINHMTVMFRRDAVLAAGNYMDMPSFEDYFLWLRMIAKGFRLANLPYSLVKARVGNGVTSRRRGRSYAKKELHFLREAFKRDLIPIAATMYWVIRIVSRVLPLNTVEQIYFRILRTKLK